MGWFRDAGGPGASRSHEQADKERRAALEYLPSTGAEFHWDMIRAAFASVARLAIVPVQDVLGLGSEARMNLPGTVLGNWEFRVRAGALDESVAARLQGLARLYGRTHGPADSQHVVPRPSRENKNSTR